MPQQKSPEQSRQDKEFDPQASQGQTKNTGERAQRAEWSNEYQDQQQSDEQDDLEESRGEARQGSSQRDHATSQKSSRH